MSYTPVPAHIARIQTMADGALRLVVDAQEMSDAAEAQLMSQRKEPGHFIWIPGAERIETNDIPDTGPPAGGSGDPAPAGGKPQTSSQRLRFKIQRFAEVNGRITRDEIEEFYQERMRMLCREMDAKIVKQIEYNEREEQL